jgi:hypothetical protein
LGTARTMHPITDSVLFCLVLEGAAGKWRIPREHSE